MKLESLSAAMSNPREYAKFCYPTINQIISRLGASSVSFDDGLYIFYRDSQDNPETLMSEERRVVIEDTVICALMWNDDREGLENYVTHKAKIAKDKFLNRNSKGNDWFFTKKDGWLTREQLRNHSKPYEENDDIPEFWIATSDQVFCSECKYFSTGCGYECLHPRNGMQKYNWLERYRDNTHEPITLNKDNDCKWYEAKK